MTMNVNAIRVAGCLGSGGTPRTWPTSSGRWLSRCWRRRGLAAARRSIHAGPLWTGSCTSCGLAAPAGWLPAVADRPWSAAAITTMTSRIARGEPPHGNNAGTGPTSHDRASTTR